jgi:hypothetical protein
VADQEQETSPPPPRGRHRQAAAEPAFRRRSAAPFADPAHWPTRRLADPGPGQPRDGHGQAAAIAAPPDYEADLSPSWPADEPAAARRGASAITLERLLSARWWPLSIILAAQIALSVRLIWRTSAFIDEALYLSVGHLELAHIFHHAPMPEVASYMSGSPVVYPPLAAVADDIGGLAGARLLSLAFIMLATVLLHGACRRLTGSRSAAFFAAALFTAIAPSQFLGAFATYDAMALALLAVAVWLGVVAADADPARRYLLIGIGGVAIMIADAAKYAATIFDPVVLAVVGLAVWRQHGRRAGLDAAGVMLLAAVVPLAVGYDLAGGSFAVGVSSTTLSRAAGQASVGDVVSLSAHATAVIAVLALLGALLVTFRARWRCDTAIAVLLMAAEFLAPAEQARIHTTTSLFKHVGYGAWFACVPAGCLLASWATSIPGWPGRGARQPDRPGRRMPSWALAVSLAVPILVGNAGASLAASQYAGWPDARPMIAVLSRYLKPGGYYLIEEPSVVNYYLRKKIPFLRVDGTYYFSYTDPVTKQQLVNAPGYALAIQRRYFAAIVIRFGITPVADGEIIQAIDAYKDYRLAATVPYRDGYGAGNYQIWVRVPKASLSATQAHTRHRHPPKPRS